MATNSKILGKLSNPLVLLLLAAALAGAVAWVAYYYLQQREESIKQELVAKAQRKVTPKVAVVVPMQDASVHTVLNSTNFVSREIEEDLVYPDTVRAADFSALEGQKLARPVLRGRPIRLSDLQLPEVKDVASIVPNGRRAMTIDIDNLNSIAQTLKPNHRVDIFLLSKAPKPEKGMGELDDKALEQVSLFMQNMVVLATGREFMDVASTSEQSAQMARPGEVQGARERDKGFDSVTLLVTPAEAARLLVGQKMGTYRVVLRGQKDLDPLVMTPVQAADLMPGVAKKKDAHAIELIVGGRGGSTVSKMPGSSTATPSSNARDAAKPASTGGLAAPQTNVNAQAVPQVAAASPAPVIFPADRRAQ